MEKMKSKKEIGDFINSKMRELKFNQSDLAGKIAEMKGEGYDRNSMRDNVSKWIRGERYPGTEYVYYLSKVLNVSIEELLIAGEVCNKYDDRPWTLYAVAKSGNRAAVEKLMNEKNSYGSCIGTNYDEYDMTLLNYIIQFKNIDLLHYLIEKEYVTFFDNQIQTSIRIGYTYLELFNDIVSLAIKYDDLYIFKKAIKRIYPVTIKGLDEIGFKSSCNPNGCSTAYNFKKIDIDNLFHAPKILNYLITPYIPNEEERGLIHFFDPSIRKEETRLQRIETLSTFFNILLNYAILYKLKEAKDIIKIGQVHNQEVQKQLREIYNKEDYFITEDGNVRLKNAGNGSLTIMARIVESIGNNEEFDLIKS